MLGFINQSSTFFFRAYCLFPVPETHGFSFLVARNRTEPSSTWTVMMILSFAMDSVATNLAIKKRLDKMGLEDIQFHEMKLLNFMETTCKALDIQSYTP